MNRPADSAARFDSRLLLETSRLLMESKEPAEIARNLGLVLMGKLLVSQAAVLLSAEHGDGYDIAFLRGRSTWKERDRIGHLDVNGMPESGLRATDTRMSTDPASASAALFPTAASHWIRSIGTPESPRGWLVFGLREVQALFDADQVDLIENVCNLASIALDHAGAINHLRETNRTLDRRIYELNTLFNLSKEFGSLLDRRRIADVLKFTLMGHLAVRHSMVATRSDAERTGNPAGATEAAGRMGAAATDGTDIPRGSIDLITAGGLKRQPTADELSSCFEQVEKAAGHVSASADGSPFMTENGLISLIGLPSMQAEGGGLKAVIGVGAPS